MSADRLTEKRTDNPYYVALVRIDQKDLDELPQVWLYPGMRATVMIQTVERIAVDYLVGPAQRLLPEIPHHTSSVLGAKISLSSTRRALRPCSWTYCATVSSTGRAALKP